MIHNQNRSSSHIGHIPGVMSTNNATPITQHEDDENDRTNISQLYNLNTVDSRILEETDGLGSTIPW